MDDQNIKESLLKLAFELGAVKARVDQLNREITELMNELLKIEALVKVKSK